MLLGRRNGRRVSAADAYVRPVRDRPNLNVIEDPPVARLMVDARSVRGVTIGAGVEHAADRVVSCAGAIRTPALLLASEIDTPGIGAGLQDHPGIRDPRFELAPEAVDHRTRHRRHESTRAGTQILAINHLPGAPQYGSLIAALMTPTSVGRVTIHASDASPVVELNQFGHRGRHRATYRCRPRCDRVGDPPGRSSGRARERSSTIGEHPPSRWAAIVAESATGCSPT